MNYKKIKVDGLELEVHYRYEEPEFERGICSYPGSVEIDVISLNDTDITAFLENNAYGFVENLKEELLEEL
jgi:hypothetical protein